MGVYIKGMDMPESCHQCVAGYGGFCFVCPAEEDGTCPDHGRPEWCPLIELPAQHGRLIDADALHKLFEDQWHYLQVLDWSENPTAEARQSGINWCINTMHDDAPTIIEAEVSE